MRLTEIIILLFVAFLLVEGTSLKSSTKEVKRQEEQEEVDLVVPIEEEKNVINVNYHVSDISEESISDINWLKKAAELARKKGVPYFNVVEQNIYKKFSETANADLTVIKGKIELISDPMSSDYDANEILSLNLGQ
jgi:hypothetical protein